MKQVKLIQIVLIIRLSFLCVIINAAPTNYNIFPISNLKYSVSGAYAEVAPCWDGIGYQPFYYYYQGPTYDIPETITINNLCYTVTGLSRKCFANYYGDGYLGSPIEGLNLPPTIETIGENAFLNCQSLIKLILPESLQSFGSSPFAGCINLREIIYLSKTPPSNWTATSFTYVPDLQKYQSPRYSINNAQIIEMITFIQKEFEYTGQAPTTAGSNNIEGYTASLSLESLTQL